MIIQVGGAIGVVPTLALLILDGVRRRRARALAGSRRLGSASTARSPRAASRPRDVRRRDDHPRRRAAADPGLHHRHRRLRAPDPADAGAAPRRVSRASHGAGSRFAWTVRRRPRPRPARASPRWPAAAAARLRLRGHRPRGHRPAARARARAIAVSEALALEFEAPSGEPLRDSSGAPRRCGRARREPRRPRRAGSSAASSTGTRSSACGSLSARLEDERLLASPRCGPPAPRATARRSSWRARRRRGRARAARTRPCSRPSTTRTAAATRRPRALSRPDGRSRCGSPATRAGHRHRVADGAADSATRRSAGRRCARRSALARARPPATRSRRLSPARSTAVISDFGGVLTTPLMRLVRRLPGPDRDLAASRSAGRCSRSPSATAPIRCSSSRRGG